MSRTKKFRHDDTLERPMPEYVPPKYRDVDTHTCEVRVVGVAQTAEHYRVTLAQAGAGWLDDRYFGLGIESDDLDCAHVVSESPDRFGYARCSSCEARLWCAHWVAEGLFDGVDGDMPGATLDWTVERLDSITARLPKLRLV